MKKQLTRRELEVLRLVAQGLANKQIAKQLGVSQYTVKNHLHHALLKLGATDRRDAARLGLNMEPDGNTRCDACPLAAKVSVVAADLQKLADELGG